MPTPEPSRSRYENAHTFPRLVPTIVLMTAVGTLVWVIVRNEPFREPIFIQAIRVFLAFSAGVVSSQLPGYLGFELTQGGRRLSTAGAMGVAVLTFLATPFVAPNLATSSSQRPPPRVLNCKVWRPDAYRRSIEEQQSSQNAYEARRSSWLHMLLNLPCADDDESGALVIAESEPFFEAYSAFAAWIETTPEPPVEKGRTNQHDVYAFLVHPVGGRRIFLPLTVQHVLAHKKNLISIPETTPGDHILLVMTLQPQKDRRIPSDGSDIPVNLRVLQ